MTQKMRRKGTGFFGAGRRDGFTEPSMEGEDEKVLFPFQEFHYTPRFRGNTTGSLGIAVEAPRLGVCGWRSRLHTPSLEIITVNPNDPDDLTQVQICCVSFQSTLALRDLVG
jgi:hypothetical protein